MSCDVTGLMSDRDLVEFSLRGLIPARPKVPDSKQPDAAPDSRPENPLLALLDSNFIGCADSDRVDLSETGKSELTAVLGAKHGHR